jgi:hypothetical protein
MSPISTRHTGILVVLGVTLWAQLLSGGEIAGRRLNQFGGTVHESFIWVNGAGNNAPGARGIGFSWLGNFTISDLPAGSYHLIAGEHGASPYNVLETPLQVPAAGTVEVELRDGHTMGSTGLTDLGECLWAAQTFVATGRDLALVSLVSPSGGSRVRVTVREDGPQGPQVGPARTFTNGSLFPAGARWNAGELSLTPGRTYAVRFDSTTGTPWRPALGYRINEYPNGHAWLDGLAIPEAELSLSMQCRDTGYIDGYRVDNWWRPNTYTEYVQTFLASGSELRLASLMPAGQESYLMRASVHQWTGAWPPGPQIGFAKYAQMSSNLMHGFIWGPGELPMTPGATYAIRYVRADGQPYAIYGDSDAYAGGQAYFDGVPSAGIDMAGRLLFKEQDRGDIQLSNLSFTPISATQARVTFVTDVPTVATVGYRLGTPVFETIVPSDGVERTTHEITVNNLTPGTSYGMSILAFNAGRNVLRTAPALVTTLAETVSLDGMVISQVGPVNGAEVILEPLGLRTFTDPGGYFHFSHVPTGQHELRARAAGFPSKSLTLEATAGPAVDAAILLGAHSNLLAGADDSPLAGWTEYGRFGGEWNTGQWSVHARTGSKWVGSVGNWSPKSGGIYRPVPVEPGRRYHFGGFVQTRAYGSLEYDPIDGLSVARIGVDPTGGTDPAGPSVIWARFRFTGREWMEQGVEFTATSSTATLFAEHKWEDFYLIPPWYIAAFDDLWIGAVRPTIPDLDYDGDVDQDDFGRFQACLSGAGVIQTDPDCGSARLDGDEDVDGDDLVIFQRCMSGPNVPTDLECAD